MQVVDGLNVRVVRAPEGRSRAGHLLGTILTSNVTALAAELRKHSFRSHGPLSIRAGDTTARASWQTLKLDTSACIASALCSGASPGSLRSRRNRYRSVIGRCGHVGGGSDDAHLLQLRARRVARVS